MGAFFQGNELWIILLILLLVLGPTKLPQLARGLGQSIREFRKASQGEYDEEEVDDETIKELAEKLGINTEGKSREELKKEVAEKAKEKGLL